MLLTCDLTSPDLGDADAMRLLTQRHHQGLRPLRYHPSTPSTPALLLQILSHTLAPLSPTPLHLYLGHPCTSILVVLLSSVPLAASCRQRLYFRGRLGLNGRVQDASREHQHRHEPPSGLSLRRRNESRSGRSPPNCLTYLGHFWKA